MVIMSLVDDGLMALDDPASLYFPAHYTGQKGTITLYEYATVLQMLLNHGLWGTNRVLSSNAVHVMLQDQTAGAHILCSPYQQYGLGETRYGIGAWLEKVAPGGSAYQIGSGGAFGFAPWLDTQRNVAGVFVAVNLMPNVFPGVQEIKAAVRTAVDTTPCHHPPRLVLQPAGANANLVTIHGARGRSYTLESSADLTTWTNLFDLPGTNGLWGIPLADTDARASSCARKVRLSDRQRADVSRCE